MPNLSDLIVGLRMSAMVLFLWLGLRLILTWTTPPAADADLISRARPWYAAAWGAQVVAIAGLFSPEHILRTNGTPLPAEALQMLALAGVIMINLSGVCVLTAKGIRRGDPAGFWSIYMGVPVLFLAVTVLL